MGEDEVLATRLTHEPRVGEVTGNVFPDRAPQVLEGRRRAGEVDTGEMRISDRNVQGARAVTRDLGISFVAYAPLGRSLLAGVVPDFANLAQGDTRARHPRFEGENFQKNRALVERAEAIAADKRCTVAQLCLAWLLAQGDDLLPIPGTKQITRLEENLGALSITLTPEEIETIAQVIPVGAAAGTRYPAGGMRGVFI